jgi:hypothetical protein
MATTWTSNYAGKPGEIMKPTLLAAPTLRNGLINIHEGVRYKKNIPILTVDEDIVQAYACDYNNAGTSATVERVITPTRLMTNMTICKETFFSTWLEDQTGSGNYRDAQIPNDWWMAFQEQAGGQISKIIELNLWQGNLDTGSFTSSYTSFNGLLTVLDGLAGTLKQNIDTLTASNVGTEMGKVRDKLPAELIGLYDEVEFFVNPKTLALYRTYVSNDFNGFEYGNTPELRFDGYKVTVATGIPDNFIVAAQRDNLHFGTNLVSDETYLQIVDTAQTLGDNNVRIAAGYSGGTQVTNESQIVLAGENIES